MSQTEINAEDCPCWAILGPTASGKTSVSLELANDLPVEIISVDSMQVYREMDIGTAKPPKEERKSVKHHMIDVVDPSEEYNVAKYRKKAEEAIAEIRERDHVPLLICGTPFYLKALLWGLFDGPGADDEIRECLRERAKKEGTEALHEDLAEVDPRSAERIDGNDVKRLVRALEVYEITGVPISDHQGQFAGDPLISHLSVGLSWDREELYERIARRVEQMLESGLVDEVKSLQGKLGPQASQAVGYKELISYFESEISFEEAVRLIKRNTRHLAKSQITWFKRFPVEEWIKVNRSTEPGEITKKCANVLLDSSAHPCTEACD